MFYVNRLSLGAVEKDPGDAAVLLVKLFEIVADDTVVIDIGIQAAVADTRLEYIPDGNAPGGNLADLIRVFRCRNFQEFANYSPKAVAWVCVVPLPCKGFATGHTSQDQRMSMTTA